MRGNDIIDKYKEKLSDYKKKLKVGISWKSVINIDGNLKSLSVKDFEPLFTSDRLIINLQYGSIENDKEYLSVRCGPLGQNGIGGHSHYDQLSIECFAEGKWIARDPGTGTYTDNLETRNLYRSLNSHWGPNIDFNFKTDFTNTFKLINMSSGNVLEFNKEYFLGSAKFGHLQVLREVKIEKGTIAITDYCKEPEIFAYKNWGEEENGCKIPFSKGYKR